MLCHSRLSPDTPAIPPAGVISDKMTSRNAAILLGFGLGAGAKLAMSVSTTATALFASKAVDRLANGIQAAPRDALIGDLAPPTIRSACFGFAQSLRKGGSFLGASSVFLLMKATGNNYQAIFLGASALSMASCLAFAMLVPAHENKAAAAAAASAAASNAPAPSLVERLAGVWRDACSMGPDFWRILLVVACYGMGHIGESMLEARAMEVGFGKAESTLVVALLGFMVFLCAFPLGKFDDKFGFRATFSVGMLSLIAGDLVLMASGAWPPAVFLTCILWGVHWGVMQGPLLSIVASHAPSHLRGTAFGIFYTVMALTAVAANLMAGSLWTYYSATATFAASATVATITLLALPWLLPAAQPKAAVATA